MNSLKKIFLALSVCLFLIIAVLSLLGDRQWFQVQEIPVKVQAGVGDPLLAEFLLAGIREQVLPYLNKSIWEVPIREINAIAQNEPWVKEVSIQRTLPNKVVVEVIPKQTLGVYLDAKGKFRPIEEDGSLLAVIPSKVSPDVPMVLGQKILISREARQEVVQLLKALPEKGVLERANVKEIHYKEAGVQLRLYDPPSEIILGHDDFHSRLNRVQHVVEYLKAQKLSGRIIDATFSKKVLVRLAQGDTDSKKY